MVAHCLIKGAGKVLANLFSRLNQALADFQDAFLIYFLGLLEIPINQQRRKGTGDDANRLKYGQQVLDDDLKYRATDDIKHFEADANGSDLIVNGNKEIGHVSQRLRDVVAVFKHCDSGCANR